jgi:hypothetical protein
MGGKAMAQRVRMDTLGQGGALGSMFDCVENALGAHWHIGRVSTSSTKEQVGFGLERCPPPVRAKLFEQLRAEHDVAVLIALALVDMNQHTGAVDIADMQWHQFSAS